MEVDVLIIGSGVAGLTLTLKLATERPDLIIALVTKTAFSDSNSNLAQGGVTAIMDPHKDSIEQHIQDTLIAGDGLCDSIVVKTVVRQGPERINELKEWGWKANTVSDDRLDLVFEGGPSEKAVVHYKDETGLSIVSILLEKVSVLKNVEMIENTLSIDLVVQNKQCYGSVFYNAESHDYFSIMAQKTILATGGIGQVYDVTTNPETATGDGVAMALRAGAQISHMEFMQFHPTALYIPDQRGKAFLISEALRGHGGLLKHEDGTEFMQNHDNRGSQAPRDVIARAIAKEMNGNHLEHVYLDCTSIEEREFILRFPNIYENCQKNGIDPLNEMIPVAPAAHYMCGGIVSDEQAKSTVENLYAIGECAYTGMHGANRLASNSLLEALVYAHNCFLDLKNIKKDKTNLSDAPKTISFKVNNFPFNPEAIREEMQQTMSAVAGIVRSEMDIRMANLTLTGLELDLMNCTPITDQLLDYYQLRNSLMVAELILGHSMSRKENHGGFYKIENVAKK